MEKYQKLLPLLFFCLLIQLNANQCSAQLNLNGVEAGTFQLSDLNNNNPNMSSQIISYKEYALTLAHSYVNPEIIMALSAMALSTSSIDLFDINIVSKTQNSFTLGFIYQPSKWNKVSYRYLVSNRTDLQFYMITLASTDFLIKSDKNIEVQAQLSNPLANFQKYQALSFIRGLKYKNNDYLEHQISFSIVSQTLTNEKIIFVLSSSLSSSKVELELLSVSYLLFEPAKAQYASSGGLVSKSNYVGKSQYDIIRFDLPSTYYLLYGMTTLNNSGKKFQIAASVNEKLLFNLESSAEVQKIEYTYFSIALKAAKICEQCGEQNILSDKVCVSKCNSNSILSKFKDQSLACIACPQNQIADATNTQCLMKVLQINKNNSSPGQGPQVDSTQFLQVVNLVQVKQDTQSATNSQTPPQNQPVPNSQTPPQNQPVPNSQTALNQSAATNSQLAENQTTTSGQSQNQTTTSSYQSTQSYNPSTSSVDSINSDVSSTVANQSGQFVGNNAIQLNSQSYSPTNNFNSNNQLPPSNSLADNLVLYQNQNQYSPNQNSNQNGNLSPSYSALNTQLDTQSYAQPNAQPNSQQNPQPSAQSNTQPNNQPNNQPNTQQNTQQDTQQNTQQDTQPNTQQNTQLNTQLNTQPNTQPNTQLIGQQVINSNTNYQIPTYLSSDNNFLKQFTYCGTLPNSYWTGSSCSCKVGFKYYMFSCMPINEFQSPQQRDKFSPQNGKGFSKSKGSKPDSNGASPNVPNVGPSENNSEPECLLDKEQFNKVTSSCQCIQGFGYLKVSEEQNIECADCQLVEGFYLSNGICSFCGENQVYDQFKKICKCKKDYILNNQRQCEKVQRQNKREGDNTQETGQINEQEQLTNENQGQQIDTSLSTQTQSSASEQNKQSAQQQNKPQSDTSTTEVSSQLPSQAFVTLNRSQQASDLIYKQQIDPTQRRNRPINNAVSPQKPQSLPVQNKNAVITTDGSCMKISAKPQINAANVYTSLEISKQVTFGNQQQMKTFIKSTFVKESTKPAAMYCYQVENSLKNFQCLLLYPNGVPNSDFQVELWYEDSSQPSGKCKLAVQIHPLEVKLNSIRSLRIRL